MGKIVQLILLAALVSAFQCLPFEQQSTAQEHSKPTISTLPAAVKPNHSSEESAESSEKHRQTRASGNSQNPPLPGHNLVPGHNIAQNQGGQSTTEGSLHIQTVPQHRPVRDTQNQASSTSARPALTKDVPKSSVHQPQQPSRPVRDTQSQNQGSTTVRPSVRIDIPNDRYNPNSRKVRDTAQASSTSARPTLTKDQPKLNVHQQQQQSRPARDTQTQSSTPAHLNVHQNPNDHSARPAVARAPLAQQQTPSRKVRDTASQASSTSARPVLTRDIPKSSINQQQQKTNRPVRDTQTQSSTPAHTNLHQNPSHSLGLGQDQKNDSRVVRDVEGQRQSTTESTHSSTTNQQHQRIVREYTTSTTDRSSNGQYSNVQHVAPSLIGSSNVHSSTPFPSSNNQNSQPAHILPAYSNQQAGVQH